MKLSSSDLRQLIDEEMRQLMTDDAIFKTKELPGMQPTRDVPGDIDPPDLQSKHSSYMAKPQIFKIVKYASKIYDMIDDDQELSDWMESYISQISQMIDSVYHNLDYKHTTGEK